MLFAQTEQEVAEAVAEWILETCPTIVGAYSYAVAGKDQGLPDVVVEIELARSSLGDTRFPYAQLQQTLLRVYDVVASIMVDSTDPEPAARLLRSYSHELTAAALGDSTLGERVQMTAVEIESDFVPQFVVYEDGTEGRQVQIRLTIAHLIEQE